MIQRCENCGNPKKTKGLKYCQNCLRMYAKGLKTGRKIK